MNTEEANKNKLSLELKELVDYIEEIQSISDLGDESETDNSFDEIESWIEKAKQQQSERRQILRLNHDKRRKRIARKWNSYQS
ncbi:MAG: hypothetical protein GDA44_09415 [Prochloron sp. SP5CPC1]|nr:hypothetical protein [Candidatus Paraprochloron terpiosi SP5CPC1]